MNKSNNPEFVHEHGSVIFKFVYDSSVPEGKLSWDTVQTAKDAAIVETISKNSEYKLPCVINYNLLSGYKIKNINDNLIHIYDNYISTKAKSTSSYQALKKSGSTNISWATYNEEAQKYFIDATLLLELEIDYSNVPSCKYLTNPNFDSQFADDYPFANPSKGCVCSQPILNQNKTNPVVYCFYKQKGNLSACLFYESDEKIYKKYLLTNHVTGLSFEIEVRVVRTYEDVYKCYILNSTDDILINELSYNGIMFGKNKSSLYAEIDSVLEQILTTYQGDYEVSISHSFEDSLLKSKNTSFTGYIDSLIPKDNHDLKKDSEFAAI